MKKLRSLLALLPFVVFGVGACGADDTPAAFDTEANAKCEPGDTPSCKCKNGQKGKKTCEDGKLSSCNCSSGEAASAAGDPTAAARPVCAELVSCDNLQPPPAFQPATGLNVGLVARTRADLLGDLRTEIARGTDDARLIAAALDGALPGEPGAVTALRRAIHANPVVEAEIAAAIPELGFGDLDAYRTRFPLSFLGPRLDANLGSSLRSRAIGENCAPSLRMRVAKITAHEDEDIITDDEIYCSISATAASVAELKITPKTPPLGNGDSHTFNATEAVFFGQGKPRDPGGDITIKYDCFEAEGNAGYAALVKTASDAARDYGREAAAEGENGYVATGANVVSIFLKLALVFDGDDHLYEAEQKIPAALQKDLVKGATWSIKKSGKHLFSDWEWSLTMEAWGCSVNGTAAVVPTTPTTPVK